jgi:hypothetical protein
MAWRSKSASTGIIILLEIYFLHHTSGIEWRQDKSCIVSSKKAIDHHKHMMDDGFPQSFNSKMLALCRSFKVL